MNALPKGITGFDSLSHEVSGKRFAEACYAAARQIGARVESVQTVEGQVIHNFHEALITLRYETRRVSVVCNAHFPLVAFASPSTEGDMQFEFVDCPELAAVLSAGFTVLTRQEACAAVTAEATALLSADELKQVHYWRPGCIGEVIFNYWD
jgi:hypothetical protein